MFCVEVSLRSGTAKFNLSNGRGDVVAQSDDAGELTWTASYEAYGKRPVETGSNLDRQRANTKEEDPTGLLNEGFRYRDLETGTWTSRDPAGFVDGPNLYAYVRQNPWSKFDPTGLSESWAWGSWVDYTGVGTYIHAVYDVGATLVGEPIANAVSAVMDVGDAMDRSYEQHKATNAGADPAAMHQARANNTASSAKPLTELATFVPGTTFSGPVSLPAASGAARLVFSSSKSTFTLSKTAVASAESLVEQTRMRAAAAIRNQSNNQRGPVLSGIFDSHTGKMFFGQNSTGALPDNLHPILKARIEALGEGAGGRAGVAGSHSEIFALNQALRAREAATGIAVKESQLSEFMLHNRSLRGERKGVGRPPRCENCNPLTKGVTTVDIDE